MKEINLGILTGISYVTGIDYYKNINEYFMLNKKPVYSLNPNPKIVMSSVDCDKYVKLLEDKQYDKVSQHLMEGIEKLVNAGCSHLAIASNTGHIAFNNVKESYPDLSIIHIADCLATELKKESYFNVGLIGTKPTMEENYLIDRLKMHGINTIVPSNPKDRTRIYDIICNELSYNNFNNDSRQSIIRIIRNLMGNNFRSCISGCTEIELLVNQKDISDVKIFPSAEIHIKYIVELLLGRLDLSDIEP